MSVNLQQPMGNGTTPFTYGDLVITLQQDAWTTVVYFPGYGTDKIICENSVLNPAIQWCAPKAETWEPPAYVAVVIPPGPPVIPPGQTIVPPPYVPPPTITPEPSMLWFGVVIIAAILMRNGIRFVLHWSSRTLGG
jgi:hypothetical protein